MQPGTRLEHSQHCFLDEIFKVLWEEYRGTPSSLSGNVSSSRPFLRENALTCNTLKTNIVNQGTNLVLTAIFFKKPIIKIHSDV